MINTVNGAVPIESLGVTSPHEHIFIDMRSCVDVTGNEPDIFYRPFTAKDRAEIWADPYAILDNALQSDIEDAVYELTCFRQMGGQTMIDCTPDEIGRDVHKLKEVSVRTGTNIILGCGHYYDKAHFPYVKNASVDALAGEMYRDLTSGIQGTDIKAGIIGEIGTSAVITDTEKKVLKAAGIVSAETGVPIHIHTDLYTENGYDIVRLLTGEGVSPEKICIDHVDVWLRPEYIRSLLRMGTYVEFDNFGKEFHVSRKRRFAYDLERIMLLKTLIDEGLGSHILISNDICLKSMWKTYGGLGYAHILRGVREMAIENGIGEDTYHDLLTKNVRTFLE